jgi:hypothetical protein
MGDFLSFKAFIAQDVLIVGYYLGALVMPVVLWLARYKLIRRFAVLGWVDAQRQQIFAQLSVRNQGLVVVLSVMIFIALEIIWRMMFEAMIGYFQMHDFLQQMSAVAG